MFDLLYHTSINFSTAILKNADLRHNSDLSRLETVDDEALRRREKYLEAIRLLTE
ncbi:MAG: hypothetical protein IK954_06245 [Clostridia bacterium]|nr:hypothetical protein [Clostridia bacterium]